MNNIIYDQLLLKLLTMYANQLGSLSVMLVIASLKYLLPSSAKELAL